MKSFLKKNIWVVMTFVLGVVFVSASIAGLGNFAAPSTYYQTGALDKSGYYDAVFYRLDLPASTELDSVWINICGTDKSGDVDTVTFYTGFASSSSGRYSYVTKTFNNDADEIIPGGWINLCSDISYNTRTYVYIATKSTLQVNEVAFVGISESGNKSLLNVTALASGGKESLYTSFEDSAAIDKSEKGIAAAKTLIDEQSKFAVKNIADGKYTNDGKSVFTETEQYTLEGIRNLFAGRGTFVDKTVNPAAQYLMGLGVLVFGENTVGLRIVPLLFTLGTLAMLFLFGKLAFNKDVFGFLFAFLFATGGFSLGFATLGAADALMSFFIVCTAFSVYKFCRKGISSKNPSKGLVNIMIGGTAYALAMLCKTKALYFAPVFAAMLVFGLIRQYLAYKARRGEKEFSEAEKELCRREYIHKAATTISIIVCGFVIVPFILIMVLFLVGYPTYSAAYSDTVVFVYALKHFTSGFTAINATSYDTLNSTGVLGWVVNQSVTVVGENKYIFGNIVVSFLNLFSILYCGGYLLLSVAERGKNRFDAGKKMGLVFPYIFFVSMWLIGWLINFVGSDSAVGGYYTASIFASGTVVTLINALSSEKSLKKFVCMGKEITLAQIATATVLLAVAAAFILAVPALTGISAPAALFTWNSLTPVIIH